MVSPLGELATWLDPERVAYWYFRLNGFLQIENFVVHPGKKGSARTDADLLAVRFPHRAELLLDDPSRAMEDDCDALSLSKDLVDVIIVEVKTNEPCSLNGPWTHAEKQNVHRVLAALGCIPQNVIDEAANSIYATGIHAPGPGLRIRLVAVGRQRSDLGNFSAVTQLVWSDMLKFIWQRFYDYRSQKTQVDQWSKDGLTLKHLADSFGEVDAFVDEALRLMGVAKVQAA